MLNHWVVLAFVLKAWAQKYTFQHLGEDVGRVAEALALDSMACTDENLTYAINLKIHAQDNVVKAIHSVAKSTLDSNITEEEAVVAYFGTMIDEINEYLVRFKVRFNMKLEEGYNSDTFMGSVVFDMSCEKKSPVVERTSTAFSLLKKDFKDNIGVHVFFWGCIYLSSLAELEKMYSNQKCGRVIGVMWKGTKETRALFKNALLNGFSKTSAYYADKSSYDARLGPGLCKYVTSCIGMDKSEIGELIEGTHVDKYTEPDSGYSTSSDAEVGGHGQVVRFVEKTRVVEHKEADSGHSSY